jgi:hypothetical protein
MMEATHLTREGRLKEAMELLLGSFGSTKFEATEPRSAPEYPTAKLRLLPPRTGSDDTCAERSPDGQTERRTTQIPRPFETLLDQMTRVGSGAGLEGLRGLVAPAARRLRQHPLATPRWRFRRGDTGPRNCPGAGIDSANRPSDSTSAAWASSRSRP